MPRGRPPRPATIQVELRGDPSKRRRNTKDLPAPDGFPEMPERFADDPIAEQEWDDVCGHLDTLGLLSTVDRCVIELYVKTYSLMRTAEQKLDRFGDVVLVGKDRSHPAVSPYYTARNKYAEDCRKLLVEMGLTPSARARMRTTVEQKTSDKWSKVLRTVG